MPKPRCLVPKHIRKRHGSGQGKPSSMFMLSHTAFTSPDRMRMYPSTMQVSGGRPATCSSVPCLNPICHVRTDVIVDMCADVSHLLFFCLRVGSKQTSLSLHYVYIVCAGRGGVVRYSKSCLLLGHGHLLVVTKHRTPPRDLGSSTSAGRDSKSCTWSGRSLCHKHRLQVQEGLARVRGFCLCSFTCSLTLRVVR
jgi:hypothetical protein